MYILLNILSTIKNKKKMKLMAECDRRKILINKKNNLINKYK